MKILHNFKDRFRKTPRQTCSRLTRLAYERYGAGKRRRIAGDHLEHDRHRLLEAPVYEEQLENVAARAHVEDAAAANGEETHDAAAVLVRQDLFAFDKILLQDAVGRFVVERAHTAAESGTISAREFVCFCLIDF